MFRWFGKTVSSTWPFWLLVWFALFVALRITAPAWESVAEEGEFAFLPAESPSRRGEDLLGWAFPEDLADSAVVILLRRDGEPLRIDEDDDDEDAAFLQDHLVPGLERIARPFGGFAAEDPQDDPDAEAESPDNDQNNSGLNGQDEPDADEPDAPATTADPDNKFDAASVPVFARIRTRDEEGAGALLDSLDGRATLVVVELTTEFLRRGNIEVVNAIENWLVTLRQEGRVPEGLEIALTGGATVGRDLMREENESAETIQAWTVWIVIGLLLIVYRAPLVALIPLLTLYCAVQIGLDILALLAGAGHVGVFQGLEVYTTVLVYGAGVDYSLFLVSRFKEELDRGADPGGAVSLSIWRVGTAIAASAGTEIIGIGMLVFLEFEKFQQAGIGIPLGLFVMLLASLTLTPSLLRLTGRWAFWPRTTGRHGWGASTEPGEPQHGRYWEGFGRWLERRPGLFWLGTVAILTPFAVLAVNRFNDLSYGLLDELPANSPSVQGTRVLGEHFPEGFTGPLTFLIRKDSLDFSEDEGVEQVQALSDRLLKRQQELRIADLRSVAEPLGITEAAFRVLPDDPGPFARQVIRRRAVERYVSGAEGFDGHVIRLEILLETDPFSQRSIELLDVLEQAIQVELIGPLEGAQLFVTGPTASLRDLRDSAQRDRWRIYTLVTVSVLVVLSIVLRRVALPIYLILSVILSYLVTFGVTYLVFWGLSGEDFAGLDWTVVVFLFAVLIAVGEDFNILLVTRYDEERPREGPIRGVTRALSRTGGIISACGFVMAGTFASLYVGGSLTSLYQLGFALAFGIMLDTFVIRPILVPTYLILVQRAWRRLLGESDTRPS